MAVATVGIILALFCSTTNADNFQYCTDMDCGQNCNADFCAKECTGENCGQYCKGLSCASTCNATNCGKYCKGRLCAITCIGENCGQNCEGEICARACNATNCGNYCNDEQCASVCTGDNCGQNCNGNSCATECYGDNCGQNCTGTYCARSCYGENCGDYCLGNGDNSGEDCAADCTPPCGTGAKRTDLDCSEYEIEWHCNSDTLSNNCAWNGTNCKVRGANSPKDDDSSDSSPNIGLIVGVSVGGVVVVALAVYYCILQKPGANSDSSAKVGQLLF